MLELDSTSDAIAAAPTRLETLGVHLDARLSRLLRSLGKTEHLSNARRAVKQLTSSWSNEPLEARPAWSSDITDDHSPFELSLSLNGSGTSVRILTEPQDARHPSLSSSWRLANELHERLRSQWGVDTRGYDGVADLFAPSANSHGVFSIWHSAILGRRQDTQFKVYLNPAMHGADGAERVVAEALDRIGLGNAWRALRDQALRRAGLDQVLYFALDLTQARAARAKVYVAHRDATAADLVMALERCPGFSPSSVNRWLERLLGGTGPFHDRPPITCFAFNRDSLDLLTTTLHLPVRCYASDDFEIARKVCELLRFPQRVSYMRALTGVAERPLESGPGLQTYVSLRPSPGQQAVTVYLAPQLYSGAPSRNVEHGLTLFGGLEEPRSPWIERRAPA
jgi:hypothetical protein